MSPCSTSGGSTPGHSVLASKAKLASEARREVWKVPPGMKSCERALAARSDPTAATAPVPSGKSISTSSGSPTVREKHQHLKVVGQVVVVELVGAYPVHDYLGFRADEEV